MTQQEKPLLKQILENQETLKGDIIEIKGSIAKIDRAVYGDKDNNVKGLLERQDDDGRIHEEILTEIEPILRIHKFVFSGKLWGILTAIGGLIGALIHYNVIKI